MPAKDTSKSRKSRPSAIQAADSPLREGSTSNIPAQQINNDMAEKANRRKSAHFGNIGVAPGDEPAGPSTGSKNGPGKRVVSALAVQAGKEGRRLGKRLSAVNPEMIGVSWEQRESKYEEWMKAAIDNKITVTNTWNFALIDYFHDMTLLRNGPDDQSINFQKASSTLDGCVKIWTSRVDSVATETGKLLSGLAGGNGEDVEEDGEGEGEDGDRPKTARKNNHRSESTLAKSFATLQVKKLDLEFSVDPLFKKTSADFDEGGAMGLLMNHLGVDGRMRVVFDAGDAVVEEEELEEELGPGMEVEVNLQNLRQFVPTPEMTENLMISDTLSSFRFSSDPSAIPDLTSIFGLKDSWNADDDGGMSDYGSVGGGGPVDFFGDDDFSGGGMGGGYDDNGSVGGDDYPVGGGMGMVASGSGAIGLGQPGDNLMPFDPKRGGGSELVMALAGRDGEGEEDGMFDYFDKGFGKRGWAGVEHWKLRKVAKKDTTAATTKKDKVAGAGKTPFVLDFACPLPSASSSKVLFAPASRTSIALPSLASSSRIKRSSKDKNDLADKYKKRRREKERQKEESANLLPDDMHFSSRQLVRLFMKPKFTLRMRRRAPNARIENAEGEIDTTFWADAAAERAGGGDDSSTPQPFESQFFADGDNDGDDDVTDIGDFAFVDDAMDESSAPLPSGLGDNDGEDGEDNLWQGSQTQIKRARPENVTFAKRAKRVDVKRLKDDIWVGLKSLVPKVVNGDDIEIDDPESETEEFTPVGEPKTFSNIITDLRRTYPRDKMSEISTSFCFICLLHLANEEGLTLEAARFDGLEGEDVGCQGVVEMDLPGVGDGIGMPQQKRRKLKGTAAGDGGEKVIGELQALRVYKDPTAGRAA